METLSRFSHTFSEDAPLVMTINQWSDISGLRKEHINGRRYLKQLDMINIGYIYREVRCIFPTELFSQPN